jgi:tripartite-type tricarboxylate transporter receptor subunit TctC
MKPGLRSALALGIVFASASPAALAQDAADYPRKPVRVVVSLAPGSAVDVLTRIFTQRLSETMGQQFVVEARPGAAGMVGTQIVSRAPADGYNLLVTTNAPLTTHFAMYKKMEYSWEDFEPIMVVAYAPVVLMVDPKLGVGSIADLIALSKKTQGGLSVATTGNGSIGHFLISDMSRKLGANFINVPYSGGPPGLMAVSTGQSAAGVLDTGAATSFIRDGRVKALGIVGERRAAALPDVPTLKEQGVPGGDIIAWVGFVAPKGTPRDIVQKLGAETGRALRDASVRQRIISAGIEPSEGSTPENFAAFLREEVARWRQRVQDAGLKPE